MPTDSKSTKSKKVRINPQRLKYLLSLYDITKEELASKISGKNDSQQIKRLDEFIEQQEIPFNLLKKIDSVFGKGINWYLTERKLPDPKQSSIFFRKEKFNSPLNFESRKITNNYEELKFEVQTLCSTIGFNSERKIKQINLSSKPEDIARNFRSEFRKIEQEMIKKKILRQAKEDNEYLKNLINIIESYNLFVFEFLETWNKKEKTNFDGFYLKPNVVVLKGQKYRRREIFTLIHEFAHYLLDSEEIDDLTSESTNFQRDSVEKWCHDFAYHFLIGEHHEMITDLAVANKSNMFQEKIINDLYQKTRLSKSALYTRMAIYDKISHADYKLVMDSIRNSISREEQETKSLARAEREFLKKQGKKPPFRARRKPIHSPLFKEIVKANYFSGNISEIEVCKYLKIKSDKLYTELY